MKKYMIWIAMILASSLVISGCASSAPAESTAPAEEAETEETETEETEVGMINPWRECTEEEAERMIPRLFQAPEGAENISWHVMEGEEDRPLVELDFDLDGLSYNARAQVTGDNTEDISGMYYEWNQTEDITLANWGGGRMQGTYSRAVGEETADLCTWYDVEIGITYTLSTVAKDLDGFDLQAVAEAMYCEDNEPTGDMPAE